jgi:DNA polymerase elongation subunit (family B)
VVENEANLLMTFILLVQKTDPDIICGYDLEKKSLSYVAQRCWNKGIDLNNLISRSPSDLDLIFDVLTF